MTSAGDVHTQVGMSAGIYFVNASMLDDYFYNADGEILVCEPAKELPMAQRYFMY